jgi:lipopolysaccharide cholinephosphotransferase
MKELPWEENVRHSGEMNRKAATQNLLDFHSVLSKYKIPYAIIFGTLLGFVREHDFIKTDTDIDIACFFHTKTWGTENTKNDNQWHNVKRDLEAMGFTLVNKDTTPWNWNVFIRDHEKIEVWWFQKIDDEWIFNQHIRYPEEYFDVLDTIEFQGTKIYCSAKRLKMLELTYGPDWETPLPKTTHGQGWALDLDPIAVTRRRYLEDIKNTVKEVLKETNNG